MAKKFLGLSMFYWVLIVLVVLFFVYGGRKVSEGFAGPKPCADTDRSTNTELNNQKKCLENRKCKWISGACKCCP
jgi:hypothetical protein